MSARLVFRLRWRPSPRSAYFLGSAVLHAGFAVAILLVPVLAGRGTPADEPPLIVDLVGAVPGATAPAAKPAPPPAVTPAEPPEGTRVEPADVKPAKKPDKEPEKRPEKKPPEPAPERPKPAPSTAGRPPSEGPASPGEGPTGDAGGSITSLEFGNMDSWYRDSIVAALQSHWMRPILEGEPSVLEVTVAFEIARDGSVRNARIDVPSGVPTLDRSALRAVADASPFPPPPSTWRDPVVSARLVFRLHPGER